MSRRHADNWSHPGHYLVDPYTWPWSPNGQDHIWPWKFKYQGHGQRQTHCQIWGLEFKSICLLCVSWQSDHFWLRYSKFHIWPWKFKVKVKSDGYIWGLEFNRCVCFFVSWQSDHFWQRYSQALTTPLARLPEIARNDHRATIFVGRSCPPNLYFENSGNKRFRASTNCSLHTPCDLDFERRSVS